MLIIKYALEEQFNVKARMVQPKIVRLNGLANTVLWSALTNLTCITSSMVGDLRKFGAHPCHACHDIAC